MDKCRVCGKLFQGIGLACPDCVEAMRMKINVSEEKRDMKSVKIPKKATVQDVTMDEVQGNLMAHMLSDTSPWGEDTPTQGKIKETLKGMTDLLLYKNQKYGDSALKPLGIFTKHIKNSNESTASILVRLDDKLSRVKNADSLRTNDVADILGYCTLLLISMGVTREDLEKFMD